MATGSDGSAGADRWILVGNPGDKIVESQRVHVQVGGRHISVLRVDGKLFCMDSLCFHGGGPLTVGDIEEIDGKKCVDCPWHHYKVTLEGGEKLYQSTVMDPETKKLKPAGWKSVGKRQRVHRVEERPEGIFVLLDTEGQVESDKYCTMEAGMIMSVSPDSTRGSIDLRKAGQPAGGGNAGGSIGGSGTTGTRGYAGMPSGQIFQRMRDAQQK